MLGTRILPAILVAVAAGLWLAGQPSYGEIAGDTCRASPGPPAPQGEHWYYRVDRATKRHCWYLSTAGIRVHSFANVAAPAWSRRESAGDAAAAATNTVVQTATAQTPAPAPRTASVEDPLPGPPVSGHGAIDFSARWQDLPRSLDLDAHDVTPPSNDYAGEGGATIAVAHVPSGPFTVADQAGIRDRDSALRQRSKNELGFGSILLACGLGILFLFLCREALKLVRMLQFEATHRHARAAFPAAFPMPDETGDVAEVTPDNAFGPALVPDISSSIGDAEMGVSDFGSILRRIDAAPYSAQSFAPAGHQPPSHQLAKIPAVRRLLRRKSLGRSRLALKTSSRSYAAV